MPDPTDTKEPDKQPDAKPKADPYAERFATLEAENKRLAGDLKAATDKADRAGGLVQRMLTQLEQAAQRGGSDDGDDPRAKWKEKFDDNPMEAIDELLAARVGPLVSESRTNQASTNREQGRAWAEANGLADFHEEVDKFMEAMPPDVKAKPGAYNAAYKYVAAEHIDEIVEKREKLRKEKESRVEGASGSEPPKGAKPSLDPMEKEMMKALGVSEEDWMRYREQDHDVPKKEKAA